MTSYWRDVSLSKIEEAFKNYRGEKALLGLDGMIDEVWKIIKERRGKDPSYFLSLKEFGELLVERGEGGISCEVEKKRSSPGGFTNNTGQALGRMGITTTLLGMFGLLEMDLHFQYLENLAATISLGDPVISTIYEFHDGKILLPHLTKLRNLQWNEILEGVGKEKLKNLLRETHLFSLGYWSNMPFFDEILLNFSFYFTSSRPCHLFFDPGNLMKRSPKEIKKTLEIFKDLDHKHPLTLSLNLHEGEILQKIQGIEKSKGEHALLALKESLQLTWIVVHSPSSATLLGEEDALSLEQDLCGSPARTTGAGDTFNAGLITGSILNLSPLNRLALATALASVYVREGENIGRERVFAEIHRLKGLFDEEGGDRE